MFDNINVGLSKLINKVSKTELKGKNLENFLEELKFVLIQNDVALSVADSLCTQLEKKAKSLAVRRFRNAKKPIQNALRAILIDILKTDEKVDIFKILESKKKRNEPTIVVFVGVNGTGKCVNADSLIPVFDGESRPIEDIYKEVAKRGIRLDDGEESVIVDPEAEFRIPSIDLESQRVQEVLPSLFWKIRNRDPLLKIEFNNGSEIQVTPEHPFFTRLNGMIQRVNAENLVKNSQTMIIEKFIPNMDSNQSIGWAKVKNIEEFDGPKFVYDLTVPYYHNFVANNIVVHNTTSIAKLAHLLLMKNYSAVIGCSDTYRAGSIEQMEEHARRVGVKTIKHRYGSDAAAVAYDSINYARSKGVNAVLIDTAGRMQTNQNLIDEMKKIVKISEPDITILVVDALTGNDAVEQGKIFNEAIKLDGIILAKLDADAKGGSAISLSHITGKPVLFVGTGQKYDDLMEFDSKFIIDNILPD